MDYDVTELRRTLERRKGERDQLLKQEQYNSKKVKLLRKKHKNIEEAKLIVQTVAQQTQEELKYHISELGTMAMEAVFPDPYKLQVEFVLKRGATEAEIWFVDKNGNKINPKDACGVGVMDVVALALRVSLHSLKRPRLRPVLILDEPFKNVNDPTRELHKKTASMIKMVCDKLGLQIVVVSLNQELIETADRVFHVKNVKGVSRVVD